MLLINVVAKKLLLTVQLIQIELSKMYLRRVLRREVADRGIIHSLTYVYLTFSYYSTLWDNSRQ